MSETKREAFRKYLETGNVLETLTHALVSLYEEPERPSDPLNYIRESIGAGGGVDVEALVRRNQDLKEEISNLTQQIAELEGKVPPAEQPASTK
jgi:DNA polymerase I-like protein with 3'-5' exonuclease and polymerase domains